jgi:cation-transporting ATPase E
VLLVASSPTKITSPNQNFSDVKPLALITIEDVIRKDAIETIQYFKNSDVNVKVISGDNPLTASKIALRGGGLKMLIALFL